MYQGARFQCAVKGNSVEWTSNSTYLAILLTAVSSGIVALTLEWAQRRHREAREDELREQSETRQDEIAVRQHREWAQQQWWEKKYRAYAELSEALWQLLQPARDEVDYYDAGRAGQNHTPRAFPFDHHDNMPLLQRTADVTQFVVAPEVSEAVSSLISELESYRNADLHAPDDIAEWRVSSIERTAKVVRSVAVRDLNLDEKSE